MGVCCSSELDKETSSNSKNSPGVAKLDERAPLLGTSTEEFIRANGILFLLVPPSTQSHYDHLSLSGKLVRNANYIIPDPSAAPVPCSMSNPASGMAPATVPMLAEPKKSDFGMDYVDLTQV